MLCNMLGLFALRAILVHGAVMVFFLLVLAPGTLDVTAKVVGGRLAANPAMMLFPNCNGPVVASPMQ